MAETEDLVPTSNSGVNPTKKAKGGATTETALTASSGAALISKTGRCQHMGQGGYAGPDTGCQCASSGCNAWHWGTGSRSSMEREVSNTCGPGVVGVRAPEWLQESGQMEDGQ